MCGSIAITQNVTEQIKAQVNILDIVQEHVVLRKQGSHYVGLCPFHAERSPSFTVSENKQFFHCFGCKKGGDVIEFCRLIEGSSFPEVIRDLADKARIALPKSFGQHDDQGKKHIAFRVHRFVSAVYHQAFWKSVGFEYCKERGLEEETLKLFYVGFGGDAAQKLEETAAPWGVALDLGVVRQNQDVFRQRVCFPIMDMRGRVCGFGARALGDEKPKYINSRESMLFVKSKVLYGVYQAQKEIRHSGVAIVVEGYVDVLMMHQYGFGGTVATCGTSLTKEHVGVLSQLASLKVIMLFDGDEAGVRAMERAMEVGLGAGCVLYGAYLPQGADPDTFLREQGAPAMQVLIDGAMPLVDSMIARLLGEAKHAEDQARALRKISVWLNLLDDVGRRVRLAWMKKEIKVELGVPGPSKPKVQKKALPMTPRALQDDALLVAGLAGKGGKVLEKVRESLGCGWRELFASAEVKDCAASPYQEMAACVEQKYGEQPVASLVRESVLRVYCEADWDACRSIMIQRFRGMWARKMHTLLAEIENAEQGQQYELQAHLFQELVDVKKKVSEFELLV